MSLGFEAAGFDTLVAIDSNPIHVATHEWNFPLTGSICADIETLSVEDILTSAKSNWSERYPEESWPGDIDCIFGGPSCQGFSEIGRRNPRDERNNLLGAFARLVAAIKPKYFVMENVPGMLAPVNDSTRAEALQIFADAKYSLTTGNPFILRAADFGIPQGRRRVFVVGNRNDVPPVSKPIPTANRVTVAEALDDLRLLERYKSLATKDSLQLSTAALAKMEAATSAYVQSLRNGPDAGHGSYGLGYSRPWDRNLITSAGRTAHRKEVRERFRATRQGAEETVSRLQRLQAGGLAPTLRAGTGRDHGSFTSARPIHHRYPRVITVREAARLHSFPDWFRFHITKWHGFQQIGNSVPPFLAEAIACEVIRALGDMPSKNDATSESSDDKLLTLSLVEAAMQYGIDPATLPKDNRRGQGSVDARILGAITVSLEGSHSLTHYFSNHVRRLLSVIVSPDTQRQPSVSCQFCIRIGVPCTIAGDFLCPVLLIGKRWHVVFRATMPKAPIHEYRYTRGCKYQVGRATHIRDRAGRDTIAKAAAVHRRANSQFRTRISRPIPPHDIAHADRRRPGLRASLHTTTLASPARIAP